MPLKTQTEEMPVLNLTSMIDVLFLLIIFFMVGTKFIESERKIGLELPRVAESNAPATAADKRVINVYRDGQITLDRKPVTLEVLTARLKAARGQSRSLGVVVRGDATSQFQLVADVLNACKQAGVSDLGVSVRMANTSKTHVRH